MNTTLFLGVVIIALIVWAIFGAIALAHFQDALVTDDNRDPLIVDLPLGLVAACGPIAWIIRIGEELRAVKVRSMDRDFRALLWTNTWQIGLCCLFGLLIGYAYYRGWCATWRP